MNFSTSRVFNETINKIKRGYPMCHVDYQKTDNELIVRWNNSQLHIEREEDGTFSIQFFHRIYPQYDIDIYDINPYHLKSTINNVYDRIDFDLNKTIPKKMY